MNDASTATYVDKFASYYMGKSYGNTAGSNFELFTMGMENVRDATAESRAGAQYAPTAAEYNDKQGTTAELAAADKEYQAWILGTLATL